MSSRSLKNAETVLRACYKGLLENAPVFIQKLKLRCEITFKQSHIAQTIIKQGECVPLPKEDPLCGRRLQTGCDPTLLQLLKESVGAVFERKANAQPRTRVIDWKLRD